MELDYVTSTVGLAGLASMIDISNCSPNTRRWLQEGTVLAGCVGRGLRNCCNSIEFGFLFPCWRLSQLAVDWDITEFTPFSFPVCHYLIGYMYSTDSLQRLVSGGDERYVYHMIWKTTCTKHICYTFRPSGYRPLMQVIVTAWLLEWSC